MVSQRSALVTGMAVGAIATLLANVATARAAPAPAGVDPAVWDMMLSNVEAAIVQQEQIGQLVQAVNNLTITLGGSPGGEDPFANMPSFTTGQLVCDVVNRGFQLPSIPIPKNKQLIVKAHPNNVGWIYLAVQRAQAQSLLISYMLLPNEGIGLAIRNADQVWVMAPTLNDGAVFIVEQE